jgi:hypothetical protein
MAVYDPLCTVVLIHGGKEITFGFHLLTRQEVENGILFRACQWLQTTCVSNVLLRVEIQIVINDKVAFRSKYNEDSMSFEIKHLDKNENQTN